MASAIKSLLDRFGRVQIEAARLVSSEIRPYTSGSSCSAWRIQMGSLIGPCPFQPKQSVFDKRKIGKNGLPFLFIYLNNFSKHSNVETN